MGAWIEIYGAPKIVASQVVAPLVGAWIEIEGICAFIGQESSLLSWERGLKFLGSLPCPQALCRSSRGSVD